MLVFGQNANIIGDWYNAEKDAVITIFEEKANSNEKATIAGKISWMKQPLDGKGNPKTDHLNPDKKLQKRKRINCWYFFTDYLLKRILLLNKKDKINTDHILKLKKQLQNDIF